MILVDANLLLYAANREAAEHERAAGWLEDQLNGEAGVGLPWESLVAFVRLVTNARVVPKPVPPEQAWRFVEEWLAVPLVWTPTPTERHAEILGALITKYRVVGKLVPDADLAALAIEHGLDVCSADSDFARFGEVRWINPLAT